MIRNADHLGAAVARLRPEVGPAAGIRVLGEGFGAVLLTTPGGLVIRVPKTADAARRMRSMGHVLPRLAPHLPVAVPVPAWIEGPVGELPFGAMAYTMLVGTPLSRTFSLPVLAAQVATILAKLHALDPVRLRIDLARVPGRDALDAERADAMEIALDWLRGRAHASTVTCIEQWWDLYRESRVSSPVAPTLIHGDLWSENLLVNPDTSRITGVLDWENLAYDDPAQDLATLLHAGQAFADRALNHYAVLRSLSVDELARKREWHWGYREFAGLAAAIMANDRAEIDDAGSKLRAGALRGCFES